jgi:translation initiation factor IF-3
MNLGIEEHDLETKMKMIKNFVEKGHPTTIKIDSKIHNKKVKKKYLFKD